ncbi:uncharacterized protein LODBEIA_P45200 [Lodderomyces beijingensis]|uniref:Golgi to ER traffic protein 1 n=1 Tax=Lodderomyces beijingensis TaxID=1775926 RepID=A0ABP0ZT63_9ASCO
MFTLDLDPYAIILTSLFILILQKLLSITGKSKIQNQVWQFYTRYLSQSKSIKLYNGKQNEIRGLTREQKAISAQDQYAKWTKLNRSLDKLKKEVQELSESIQSEKLKVDGLTSLLLSLLVTLPIWVMRIFCRKTALFYLRKGVLPDYLEWWLALPFFKSGTIGLTCWMFAVNNVLAMAALLISFPFAKAVAKPVNPKGRS